MDNDFSDSVKKMLSSVKLEVPKLKTYDVDPFIFESKIADMDPDSFAPNRTAKSTEQMVELLQEMKRSSEEEAKIQAKRHKQIFWLTIAVLVVTAIGVLLQLR